MAELIYRTEDISSDDIEDLFVETVLDRTIIDALKAASPVVVVGSRGVGKSFLLRIAENELEKNFKHDRVMPIYVSFNRSSLIHSNDQKQFFHWMLSIICGKILRNLRKYGLLANLSSSVSLLAGGKVDNNGQTRVEEIIESFEASWQNPQKAVDVSMLPSIDDFKDAIEEICEEFDIKRFNILIDEAAHIFRPEQQRQFFTLFRDLRMPRISCNAAVYPGVTFYGDSFQPIHDATFLYLDRNIFHADYLKNMREIVENQIESTSDLLKAIAKNSNNFNVLAYASSGNPRILLKTVGRAEKMNSGQINEIFREFYKTEIWTEHSQLGERYIGHRAVIDWGRKFIETEVLPELKAKNDRYLGEDKKTTCFFWIHRDCPQSVKEALRLLTYTGLISENAQGIKASRSEIGTRFQVNLGILFAMDASPVSNSINIATNIYLSRMSEYGMNHNSYNELSNIDVNFADADASVLQEQLTKDISQLDLANWQITELRKIHINNIGDILRATETKLREMYYVGEKRARRIKSAAMASVLEYLSG
jgi:hypothetical protein